MTLYTDIDPFCCAVLASRAADGSLPDGDVVMADIRDLNAQNIAGYHHIHTFCGIGGIPLGLAWSEWPESVSIITGGFPCQDISTTGKGAGLSGDKSGLFWELRRILMELNEHGDGPELVILENVGALSRRGLDVVASALGEAGYVVPESYRVGAWAVGAPHERERWWIVGWRVGRAKPDGVRGWSQDAEAGREGRAGTSAAGPSESGGEVADSRASGRGAVGIVEARTKPDQPGEVGDALRHGWQQRPRLQDDQHEGAPPQIAPEGSGENSTQPDSGGTRREAGRREQGNQGRAWSRGYQPGPSDWRRNTRTVPITDNGVVVGHETKADEWFWAGPPILAHARGAGLGQQHAPAVAGDPRHAAGRPDPTIERGWPVPVLPGYVQHDWELPRLYQRGVGDAVHGLPRRVAGARNRSGVMALGNAVVPQVVAAIGKGVRAAIGDGMTTTAGIEPGKFQEVTR